MIRPIAILLATSVAACAADERSQPHWPETLAPVAVKKKPEVRGWVRHTPARTIVKREVVSKPEKITDPDIHHCKQPLTAVGDQALSEETARTAAEKHWMANVRWRDGEKYMDVKNARIIHMECSRSSIPPTNGIVGQVIPNEHRCEIIARPCRPGLEK